MTYFDFSWHPNEMFTAHKLHCEETCLILNGSGANLPKQKQTISITPSPWKKKSPHHFSYDWSSYMHHIFYVNLLEPLQFSRRWNISAGYGCMMNNKSFLLAFFKLSVTFWNRVNLTYSEVQDRVMVCILYPG